MADRKSHRQMTSAEQVRRSESRYGRGGAAHAATPRPRSGGSSRSDHAASRAEGARVYSDRIKSKRRKRTASIVAISLVSVFLVALVGAGAFALSFISSANSNLHSDTTEELRQMLNEPVEAQDPFYMLLLGVDKSEWRAEDWGSDASNFRSDTIILARIDAPAQKVTLVSIPRDTLVDMGVNGERKINDAYSIGGAAYMLEVVEEFSGVDITAYAEVDFEKFTAIVDTIGGVEVTLPIAISDEHAAVDLPAGTQTLNGAQALGLCRARHAYDDYGGGDFYRAANQRMVIGAIVKKVLQLDLVSMATTVSELADSVTTDLGAMSIISLVSQFRNLDADHNIYSGQTPTISEYINSIWYEIPDTDAWEEMMERVDAGESPYSDASQDFTAGIAGSIGDGTSISDADGSDDKGGSDEVSPSFSGSVSVLNGAAVSGLAGEKSDALAKAGFEPEAGNAPQTVSTTTVYYNGEDAYAAALGVAETLGIPQASIAPNNGSYTTAFDVVVVLGTDQA